MKRIVFSIPHLVRYASTMCQTDFGLLQIRRFVIRIIGY
jgi:hypothetical protein